MVYIPCRNCISLAICISKLNQFKEEYKNLRKDFSKGPQYLTGPTEYNYDCIIELSLKCSLLKTECGINVTSTCINPKTKEEFEVTKTSVEGMKTLIEFFKNHLVSEETNE